MKIRSEQLQDNLDKSLTPVYMVHGDEPFQLEEACTAIRACIKAQGFSERQVIHVDKGFDWQQFLSAANSLSLFAQQRVIELRMPSGKPGDRGSKALIAYTKDLPADTILLIITGKLDPATQRSKWYRALDQVGIMIPIWPMDVSRLPQWIKGRMQMRGLRPSDAALALLAERSEGNLLAADQELEKLLLLYGEGAVDVDQVTASVTDSAHYDIFTLVDVALSGDAPNAMRILQGLQAEGIEAVLVLWALTREIRAMASMALKVQQGTTIHKIIAEHRIWDKRKPYVRSGLQRHPQMGHWYALLRHAGQTDRIIKGMLSGKPWNELLQLTLGITGTRLIRPMVNSRRAVLNS